MLPGLKFDHVGIPTDDRQPNENWVEETRVWVTSPREHKYGVEFLRYEPDSQCPTELQRLPHVAYRVPLGTLDDWTHRYHVLLEPFEAQKAFLRVSFVMINGGAVEFMEFAGDPEQWFPNE
jgi:hypothetical protein